MEEILNVYDLVECVVSHVHIRDVNAVKRSCRRMSAVVDRFFRSMSKRRVDECNMNFDACVAAFALELRLRTQALAEWRVNYTLLAPMIRETFLNFIATLSQTPARLFCHSITELACRHEDVARDTLVLIPPTLRIYLRATLDWFRSRLPEPPPWYDTKTRGYIVVYPVRSTVRYVFNLDPGEVVFAHLDEVHNAVDWCGYKDLIVVFCRGRQSWGFVPRNAIVLC